MNIYHKNKTFTWQKITTGIIALFLFIWVLNIFQSPIKNSLYLITSPFSKMLWSGGNNTSNFLNSFLNTKAVSQENDNLKQENQNLLSQIALLQETIKADQAIQSVIENTKTDEFTLAFAQTIGMDVTRDIMLINKGSRDGITEDMPVISNTKVLFGKVYKVYKNFSEVMLISNKNSVVDAKILPRSGIPSAGQPDFEALPILGVVKGSGSLSLYLDLVSFEAQISEFDTLVTSGQEGVFPKDLLIGKIQSNNKNDLKPFQTASVTPGFDVNNSENVFVITDYK